MSVMKQGADIKYSTAVRVSSGRLLAVHEYKSTTVCSSMQVIKNAPAEMVVNHQTARYKRCNGDNRDILEHGHFVHGSLARVSECALQANSR